MNAGRTVRVEVARGLEIAVDVEGGGFRACDLSCEVDAEAFFRADKLDAVRVLTCFNDSSKRAKWEGERADVVLWSMESISGCSDL